MTVRFVSILYFSIFFWHLNAEFAFASEKWGYQRFSVVKSGTKLNFPTALTIQKERLEAKIKPQLGTHFLLGIDQLYHSRDLKKKILIKQNAVPTTSKIFGKWIKLKNGHVFHYKTDGQYVAIFVQGYSGKILKSIERVFVQNRSRQKRKVSIYSLMISCAYGQGELGSSAGGNWHPPNSSLAEQYEIPLDLAQVNVDGGQNIAQCMLNKSANHIGEMAGGAWDVTQKTADAVWNDPFGAATNTWNFLYGAGESVVGGVYNAGVAVTSYCYEKCLSPNRIWDDAATAVDSMYLVGQQLYQNVAEAIGDFNELDGAVKSQLVCEIGGILIAEVGVGAVGGYLTGVGAVAATARITALLTRMQNKVKGSMETLKLLGQSQMSPAEKQAIVTAFMQDKKSEVEIQAELARLRQGVAEGISSGKPEGPLPKGPSLTPAYHNIGHALVDQEFEIALRAIPESYRVTTQEAMNLKAQVLRQVLSDSELPNYQQKELDSLVYALSDLKEGLIDQKKVMDDILPAIKADLKKSWRGTEAQFNRQWTLFRSDQNEISVEDVFRHTEFEPDWDIGDYKTYLAGMISSKFEEGIRDRNSTASSMKADRIYEYERKRQFDWEEGIVRPGEERSFARWAAENNYPHRESDWLKGIVLQGEEKIFARWATENNHPHRRSDWLKGIVHPGEEEIFAAWVAKKKNSQRLKQDKQWDKLTDHLANASDAELRRINRISEQRGGILPKTKPIVPTDSSTAVRAAYIHGKNDIPIKISSSSELGCENCPKVINFWAHDSHFDDHIIDRLVDNNALVQQYMRYVQGRNEVSSDLVAALSAVARVDSSTSLWDVKTRNSILNKIVENEFIPLPVRPNDPNTRALLGKIDGYEFRVIICQSLPCKGGATKIGDVIAVYPICGPKVLSIADRSKFDSCLQGASGCNKKKLVHVKKCKP